MVKQLTLHFGSTKEYINNYVNNPDKMDQKINTHPYYWTGIIPIGKMDAIEVSF